MSKEIETKLPVAAATPCSVPDQCPQCGIERADGWVHGYHGWKCGTYWQSNSDSTDRLKQSIDCAVTHWKKRALKAEWLLSLITPPNAETLATRGLKKDAE